MKFYGEAFAFKPFLTKNKKEPYYPTDRGTSYGSSEDGGLTVTKYIKRLFNNSGLKIESLTMDDMNMAYSFDVANLLNGVTDNKKRIALIMRHSIRAEMEEGGMLTEDGKRAAQVVGSKINSGIPITYFATDVQRCIDTCKNIEFGRTGDSDVVVNASPKVNERTILSGGYFQNGEGNLWDDGWPGVTQYALGEQADKYPYMLDPKEGAKDFVDGLLTVMPEGLSIWVTHDSQAVPLIYNLTGITSENVGEMRSTFGWNNNPWTAPLSGIAIIDDGGKVTIKRIKGLKQGLISSDDYNHDHVADIIEI